MAKKRHTLTPILQEKGLIDRQSNAIHVEFFNT
jgi:hypothetical protein